ncbi:signal-transducing adaptor protein 1 [Spea bombifrons]|uniref:signal-transducing adaptor protein 1 n=1 Tax=Spea bombifrons TaxID=233779 RepID=UPI002349FDF3|nr:signal-transducing adaptor protein 1 [Spea bombifrons]XP_053317676.1 signal-transducing adaptor protein 1 [Spea bombifrons]
MAFPAPAPRKIYEQRSMLTKLPLYYEGFLWIKRSKSKEIKYWTELRGTKFFLYSDKRDEIYTDEIDLQSLVSVEDKPSVIKQWAEVILTLANEEVHIKTELAEDAEFWKGFILTVVELSVPKCLNLLPGQLIRLQEVLEKQRHLRTAYEDLGSPLHSPDASSESYQDVIPMPLCFHNVSRTEAADMLLKMRSNGNLILRPGADSKNYAVTICEPTANGQVKHYKILTTEQGYTIELDNPVTLRSLHDVVEHFVKETSHKLKPFVSYGYETKLATDVNKVQKTFPETTVRPVVSTTTSQGANTLFRRLKENSYINVPTWKVKM